MSTKWDKRFIKLAKEVSTWSKDPSTKIGAVFVRDRIPISFGYNGFPRNIADTTERLNNRPTKLSLTSHAEMNGIFNATRNGVSLNDSTLYVWGLPVCSNCALGVIQAGVSRVIMPWTEFDLPEHWLESGKMTLELFNESGISVCDTNLQNIS